jgi:hypothetical protein
MSEQTEPVPLKCEMEYACKEPVTMIDDHGWIYCTEHGLLRRPWRRCRKLRPHELNRLRRGLQVRSY